MYDFVCTFNDPPSNEVPWAPSNDISFCLLDPLSRLYCVTTEISPFLCSPSHFSASCGMHNNLEVSTTSTALCYNGGKALHYHGDPTTLCHSVHWILHHASIVLLEIPSPCALQGISLCFMVCTITSRSL